MKKTTLEYDEDLFDRVRNELGTKGLKQTVQRAFEEIIRARATEAHIRRLQTMEGLDLDKPEVMAQAWRRWHDT